MGAEAKSQNTLVLRQTLKERNDVVAGLGRDDRLDLIANGLKDEPCMQLDVALQGSTAKENPASRGK